MEENETNQEMKKYVEEKMKALSDTEIEQIGKNQRKTSLFGFIALTILGVIFVALGITMIVLISNPGFLIVSVIVFPICIYLIMKPKMFKWDSKQWATYKIESDYKAMKNAENRQKQEESNKNSVDGKIIKHTKIIDSYTEMSDKLHPFLNYQEIIQHRMYKFLVTFEDNTTQIYTAEEGTKLYNTLMSFLTDTTQNTSDISEQLVKYKKLLDEGAITEEEFKQLKNNLINKQ